MGVDREGRASGATLACWAVHGLTASGAVIAYAALVSIEQSDWGRTLLLLLLALVVDGVDGPLARLFGVRSRLPLIDGALLDLLVDFLTYVFVPTVFIFKSGLAPAALALPLVAVILVSALFHYTRRDLKTGDNFFRGFPALWNVVAFYLYFLKMGPVFGGLAICLFSGLTFSPVLFVHPVRVKDFRPWAPLLCAAWAISSLALFAPVVSGVRAACLAVSLLAASGLIGFGLIRTLRGANVTRLSEVAA